MHNRTIGSFYPSGQLGYKAKIVYFNLYFNVCCHLNPKHLFFLTQFFFFFVTNLCLERFWYLTLHMFLVTVHVFSYSMVVLVYQEKKDWFTLNAKGVEHHNFINHHTQVNGHHFSDVLLAPKYNNLKSII